MSDSEFAPRVGSDIFNTSVMKAEEVLLFVEAALEQGDLNSAYEDMKMIDNLLHMQRLHLVVHGTIKKTKSGYLRKGSDLHTSLISVIDGRIKIDREENNL